MVIANAMTHLNFFHRQLSFIFGKRIELVCSDVVRFQLGIELYMNIFHVGMHASGMQTRERERESPIQRTKLLQYLK